MPDCKTIDPLVTPFVDGELPDADRRSVEDHLRVCAPCHSRVVAEQAVHTIIKARCESMRTAAPEALRARCRELAVRSSTFGELAPVGAPRRAWVSRAGPLALAASLTLIVGGAFTIQATRHSDTILAAELAADHVKCVAMNRMLGTHQEAAAVESSMFSGFNWSVRLPEHPEHEGMQLVGSRPCLYGDGKIAHIMYRHEGKPVSLFMLPKTSRAQNLVSALGHEAAIWCVGNRTFVLLAREPRREVERMADYVRASLH